MSISFLNFLQKFAGIGLGTVVLLLTACVGGTPGGISGAPGELATNPGEIAQGPLSQGAAAPLDPQGPSPEFDPEDIRKLSYHESQREISVDRDGQAKLLIEGIVLKVEIPEDVQEALEGELDGTLVPIGEGKAVEAEPCCEGRWLLARVREGDTCVLNQIKAGGKVGFAIPFTNRVPELDFFISKLEFNPTGPPSVGPCNLFNSDNFFIFPIGHVKKELPLLETASLDDDTVGGQDLGDETELPLDDEEIPTIIIDRSEILKHQFRNIPQLLPESSE